MNPWWTIQEMDETHPDVPVVGEGPFAHELRNEIVEELILI